MRKGTELYLIWITARYVSEGQQCSNDLTLQTPVAVVFSVTAITGVSIFKPINTNFIFHIYSFDFNYVLIFLNRRNSSLPLWDPLFICNDCGFVPSKDGAFYTDILKAAGKTLNLAFFCFIQASFLFKIGVCVCVCMLLSCLTRSPMKFQSQKIVKHNSNGISLYQN